MAIGKFLSVFVVGCTGFGSPLAFSLFSLGGEEAKDYNEEKVRNLVLADASEGGILSVNLEKLFKNKEENKPITFNEAKIKFEGKELSKNDLLASPCKNGKYYFAKYLKQFTYRLAGEEFFGSFPCKLDLIQKATYVKLNWARPKNVFGSAAFLSTIGVESCKFHKVRTPNQRGSRWKVIVQCNQFGIGNGDWITGVFGDI